MLNCLPEWFLHFTFPAAMYESGNIFIFFGEPPSYLGSCGLDTIDPSASAMCIQAESSQPACAKETASRMSMCSKSGQWDSTLNLEQPWAFITCTNKSTILHVSGQSELGFLSLVTSWLHRILRFACRKSLSGIFVSTVCWTFIERRLYIRYSYKSMLELGSRR